MQIVRRQNRQGATVLMISHDMEIVQDYTDRVLVLHEGRLLGDGPARRVLALSLIHISSLCRQVQLL